MLDGIADRLEQYMSLLSKRQQLVSANIANADTPGYKTVDVDFHREFSDQMASLSPVQVPGLKVKNDGNNVSLDREAQLLAENNLRFNIATQVLRTQIRVIKNAIHEGNAG